MSNFWMRQRREIWQGGGFVFLCQRAMSSRKDSVGGKLVGIFFRQGKIARELAAKVLLTSSTEKNFISSTG